MPTPNYPVFEINVGNIGMWECKKGEAHKTFKEYVFQSKSGRGRAGGESVYLFRDGEIIKQYIGTINKEGVD